MKHIVTIFAAFAIALALPACSDAKTETPAKAAAVATTTQIDHVNAQQAADIIKKQDGIVVLDVRTPGEFASGHIDGAVNVDFKNRNFENELSKFDKNQTYLIHCRSGGRSTASLKSFKKLGFKHIIHMDGGMIGWNKANLPTVN
ncbi:MAG TPA: rhodanese-like domain-containing protein [Hellea balneolensis]|uniref:Rhodanese-like domain-containing protein n=1 Tax=Hellea balneolensis TaxID=287478 RepID=A0A7C5R048_9PROT|nr:rhodanese-like domain-containing protein [Hellea balneolensis]